jgi:hypothetical protein
LQYLSLANNKLSSTIPVQWQALQDLAILGLASISACRHSTFVDWQLGQTPGSFLAQQSADGGDPF